MLQLESLATRLNAGCFVIDGGEDTCNLQDAVGNATMNRIADFWSGLNSRQKSNFYFVVTKVCDMETAKTIGSYTWMRDAFKEQYRGLIESHNALRDERDDLAITVGRQEIDLAKSVSKINDLSCELANQDIQMIRLNREIEALKAQLAQAEAFKQSLRNFLA